MTVETFLKGLLIGLSIAAPVGPISLLYIRRTLADGRIFGVVSGMGAASADALYGAVAAFGLTSIRDVLVGQQFWLHLIGGGFLCYLGIRAFLSKPPEREIAAKRSNLAGAYGSTFFLTLTNPMTILSFLAVFSSFGFASVTTDYWISGILVLGVFSGSVLWSFILSSGVSLARGRIDVRKLQIVNKISGIVIAGFGLIALLTIFA